jgi:hypothetical protein
MQLQAGNGEVRPPVSPNTAFKMIERMAVQDPQMR